MKTGSSKALLVAAAVAAGTLGVAVGLDAGKCNGFADWFQHARCGFADDTIWAEGYSESGFKQIVPGMTAEEVVRLVGWSLNASCGWWEDEGSQSSGTWKFWEYAQCGEAGWVRQVHFAENGRTVRCTVRYHWPD